MVVIGYVKKIIDKLLKLQNRFYPEVKEYYTIGKGKVSLLRVIGVDGESVLLKCNGSKIEYARGDETPEHIFVCSTDSVPWYSPIIVKNTDGIVHIVPIEELWEKIHGSILVTDKGEEIKAVSGLRALTSGNPKWTRIKAIIRHPWKGELVRIVASTGVVDVSPNHSIYVRQGSSYRLINAKDVEIGDVLLTGKFVKPKPRYLFVGTERLAWLYGFFAAEGCVSTSFYKNNKGYKSTAYYTIICNTDSNLLDKTLKIIRENFHKSAFIDNRGTSEQSARIYSKDIYFHFYNRFITSRGLKKVPAEILNGPMNIKKKFLEGYYMGDGYEPWKGAVCFDSKSWALLQGILWLEDGRTWSVGCRKDKPNVVRILIHTNIKSSPKSHPGPRMKNGEVKQVLKIPYEGYLYDLVTEDGKFITGVGNISVHNTFLDIISGEETLREAITKGHFSIENSKTGTIDLVEMQRWASAFERLKGIVRRYVRV